jgi:hypothetical protein
MSEEYKFEEGAAYPSTLGRLRRNALWCFAGGIALVALRFIARNFVFAAVGGGAVCAVGIGWLMANNPSNKKIGAFIIGAGALLVLSRIPVPHVALFSGIALNVATMWLIVTGARNAISYVITKGKHFK